MNKVRSTLNLVCCYAHADMAMMRELMPHLSPLEHGGLIVWHDGKIVAGDPWNAVIRRQVDDADIILLLVSPDFFASKYIRRVEMKRALERQRAGTVRVIPVILRPVDWQSTALSELQALPAEGKPVCTSRRRDFAWLEVAQGIRHAVDATLAKRREDLKGIVNAKLFRKSRYRFAGETYAIELLREPLHLHRDADGICTLTVDRTGVKEYIISNEGKRRAEARYIPDRNREQVQEWDRKLQAFLAGEGESTLVFDARKDPGIQLRWASGGVLSIVRREGDPQDKRWVPFFFRDIKPYGWNIALGSAERWFGKGGALVDGYSLTQELDQPESFILREFLEETMVIAGDPAVNKVVAQRKISIVDGPGILGIMRGYRMGERHRELRSRRRDVNILDAGGDCIEARPVPARMRVVVKHDGQEVSRIDNVLVAFSLLDLGIEVVRVKRYKLAKNDYLLDGEIQAGTVSGEDELVRMPMALIAESYLRKHFGKGTEWQKYTNDRPPCITLDRPPDPRKGEIHLFPFDAVRRAELAQKPEATQCERRRFAEWMERFGHNFFVNGKPSVENASGLFVPATAKLLNLFFTEPRKKTKSKR